MFITMLADFTAFVCLVFGYFFFWTVREDFPPDTAPGPGVLWPLIAAVFLGITWISLWGARRWNKLDLAPRLLWGTPGLHLFVRQPALQRCWPAPSSTELSPTRHVYDATVWLLVLWTAFHVLTGLIMQLYCVARRLAGRMTARHDIDISNVTLYWHFVAVTVLITVSVIAGFPLVMR